MRSTLTVAALAVMATLSGASPVEVEKRQSLLGMDSNDLNSGSCKPVIFIFARGSMEPGNMGVIIGPATCSGLKQKFPNKVACQGVGGSSGYVANVVDNANPRGTTQEATNEAVKVFNQAFQKCPTSKIVFGGYSQGGAVMQTAVQALPAASKNKLTAGVLFGDTLNQRNKHQIPGFPADKVLEICNSGDGICDVQFRGITAAHLSYGNDGGDKKAVDFLASKIGRV